MRAENLFFFFVVVAHVTQWKRSRFATVFYWHLENVTFVQICDGKPGDVGFTRAVILACRSQDESEVVKRVVGGLDTLVWSNEKADIFRLSTSKLNFEIWNVDHQSRLGFQIVLAFNTGSSFLNLETVYDLNRNNNKKNRKVTKWKKYKMISLQDLQYVVVDLDNSTNTHTVYILYKHL